VEANAAVAVALDIAIDNANACLFFAITAAAEDRTRSSFR
jgi:hypothetical protein